MFEDYYMPQFDMDYFNSPAFQQAIASAVQQYSPAPVEPVYYAPEPVYYAPPPAPEITAGIGDIPQYMVEDYGLIGGAPDRFTAPQISAEQLAAERYAADQAAQQMEAQRAAAERYAADQAAQQAEAQRVAAEQAAAAQYAAQQAEAQRVAAAQAAAEQAAAQQAAAAAEAQRVAAAQELAARAEAERVAAERAAAAEAAAQRQQTELNERRAQAAQAAAERAAQERALAEQAAAQAAAEAQAAAQAQAEAAAQAEAQRVAAAQAQAEAQAQAQAAEQARVQAAQQAEAQRVAAQQAEAQRAADAQAAQRAAEVQAEAQRVAAEQAQAEQARVQAEAAAAVTPAPEPVYAPELQPLAGIGRSVDENYYTPEVQAPEQTYTPAPVAAPEADVVRGIGGREVSAEPDYGFVPEQIYAPEPVPAPVYTPPAAPTYYEPAPVAGIGRDVNYYEPDAYYGMPEETYAPVPESVYTPAVEPVTIEAEPVAGIGSPAVAAPAEAPSVIEAAVPAPAASPAAAPAAGTQVINNNDYSPSDTDLQTMQMSRDQWNEMMASLATLDLGNLNFGNFGVTSPGATNNFRTFTAPKSNKGNPTSTVAKKDNTFNVIENQPVRLVDMRTKKVVFQGTGYEAAEKAIELAAGLTKAGGNKADWEIQTGQFKNPGSGDLSFGDTFKTVANEKRNTSIFNQALDIIGDAALGFIVGGPMGAAIAAGASAAGVNVSDIAYPIIATMALGPLGIAATTAATIGAATLGTAVSSAVQGRSVEETLIRSAITAATAGVLKGTDVGGKITDAVGSVMADLNLVPQLDSIVDAVSGIGSEAATREIVVTAATEAAAIALTSGATASTVSGAIVDAVKNVVPDYVPSKDTTDLLDKVDTSAAEAAADPTILVKANPITNAVSGVNPIVKTEVTPPQEPLVQQPVEQPVEQPTAEEPPAATVTGIKTTPGVGIGGTIPGIEDLIKAPEFQEDFIDETARPPATELPPAEEPPATVVTGGGTTPAVGIGGLAPIDTSVPTPPPPAPPATEPPPAEEEPAATVTGLKTTPGVGIGGVIPGVEDLIKSPEFQEDLADEQAGKDKDKSLLEKIGDVADIVQVAAPIIGGVIGGGGDGGGTIAPDTSKINFTKTTLRPTIPVGGIGGVGGYPYTPQTYGRRGGDQETEYLFFTKDPVTGQELLQSAPAPIATPIANEPAGPAMILPSGNTFAEGGEVDDDMVKHLVEYHKNGGHQGPGQVKGIGSGQDDKIPAWLSDGEYVWSAQDVADLGDGSTDEGVRRLDKMRQMVRRQAGRKDVKKIAKPQKGIDTMLKAVGGLV
jgi:hypothetical protein